MRFTELATKTSKNAPDVESINARLLIQAGFVDQVMAGVYSWLPLGLRVLRNVERIVREEMGALGGQEVLLPSLHPKTNWEQTGRWNSVDVLYKVKDSSEREFALGPTHEEIVTPLAKKYIQSYRDLPRFLFQIQTKFRDEPRAKSGVLRGREFGMKDLYSFHRDEKDLHEFYPKAIDGYKKLFSRCGLDVVVTEAAGGAFTKKHSHEFHVLTPAGEDRLLICEDRTCGFAQNAEISIAKAGENCPICGRGKVLAEKGIEAGNIFDLGTKFSEAFDLKYLDENGEQKLVYMGCYGIGTTRLVGSIVEAHHDEHGMIWPESVAPYRVHLVLIARGEQPEVRGAADDLYRKLQAMGVEVLYDDRPDVSAGAKLADADLIGCPIRLVMSEKTFTQDVVEWKERRAKESELVPELDIFKRLK